MDPILSCVIICPASGAVQKDCGNREESGALSGDEPLDVRDMIPKTLRAKYAELAPPDAHQGAFLFS